MYGEELTKLAQCGPQSGGLIGAANASYQPPTARQQLQQKMAMLQAETARVQKALDALDAHPELEAFTETLKAALR